jgi:putative transposase
MIIEKGYKIRLYPNKTQEERLLQICGSVRFVWNYYLDKRKQEYLKNRKTWNYYDCAKDLTRMKKQEEYMWLDNMPVHPLQQSLRDLETAYVKFFKTQAEFPKFKSKKDSKKSFRMPVGWKIRGNKIQLARDLTMKFRSTKIEGELKSITVSQDTDGEWYGSIISYQEINPVKKTGDPIGIDMGLTHLAVTSQGKEYENLKPRKKLHNRLKQIQQSLSRKKGGSLSRKKAKLLVGKLHKKISNQRMNHLHQTSHSITSENQAVIVCEDLAIKNVMKNHRIADSFGDSGLAEFMKQLEYKQTWRGGEFKKIDRFFPSSKLCSNCKYIVDKLPLSIREWECPNCDIKHDRDINAAKNILAIGLSNSLDVESKDGIVSNHVELPA